MFEIIYRFDPTSLNTYKSPDTTDEARRQLEAGNRQFAELTDPILGQAKSAPFVIESDSRAFAWDTSFGEAPRQAPFAAVLACSDARVPTELVFLEAAAINSSWCALPAISWAPSVWA